MDVRSAGVIAFILGGVAGAAVAAGLVAGPVAHADNVATLPVPPLDPADLGFYLPGTRGALTNEADSSFPGLYYDHRWDAAYTVPDGTYEVQHIEDNFFGSPVATLFVNHLDQVIASDGAAPAVGTVWDYTAWNAFTYYPTPALFPWVENYFQYDPTTGFMQDLFQSAGGLPPGAFGNYFASGPDGVMDELIILNHAIPIFDFPASTAADLAGVDDVGGLGDFSALWSDLAALF